MLLQAGGRGVGCRPAVAGVLAQSISSQRCMAYKNNESITKYLNHGGVMKAGNENE